MAADEWAENVDNNAFTNGAAKVLLQDATEAAGILGIKADPDWMVVSDNIPILTDQTGLPKSMQLITGKESNRQM